MDKLITFFVVAAFQIALFFISLWLFSDLFLNYWNNILSDILQLRTISYEEAKQTIFAVFILKTMFQ